MSRNPPDSFEADVIESALSDVQRRYYVYYRDAVRDAKRRLGHQYQALAAFWVITLLLGASVPLAQSLGGSDAIIALLGFAIVVTQGLYGLYLSSADSTPYEQYSRQLRQQFRLKSVCSDPYTGDVEQDFRTFTLAVEKIRADFDEGAISHNRSVFKRKAS